jgi:hypothetical protein
MKMKKMQAGWRKEGKKGAGKAYSKAGIAKIFLILAFVATLSLLIGCKKEKKVEIVGEGLYAKFVEQSPPPLVSVNQQFPIAVDVVNNGDYDVRPGSAVFYLQGLGTNVKGYSSKMQNKNLISKAGGQERIVFAQKAYSDLPLTTPFNLTIALLSCYDYSTTTQAKVCIAKSSSSICKLEGNKITETSNSKAPVKITQLTENVLGNRLTIEFVIQNLGGGQLYLPTVNCDKIAVGDPFEKTKANYVNVQINDGGEGFSCELLDESMSSIKGLGGIAQQRVRCEKTLGNENYEKPIQIVLSYKYVSSISKPLTISPY